MISSTPIIATVPASVAKLGADHVAERAAVAARRGPEHDEVLHGAGEDDADDQPERSRQISHLRREHGADQRPGAGDRREVVAEEDGLIGRAVVEPVVEALRRRQDASGRGAARARR